AVCGNGAGNGVPYPRANRETVLALLEACARADGVFLYQGHSESGALDDPEAASLLLEPLTADTIVAEQLSMGELVRAIRRSALGRMPRRAAFLSCGSGVASQPYDATGIAMAALAGGSDAVVSTLRPISDDGPWSTLVNDLVETLLSAEPWQMFGHWQQQVAPQLESLDEDARRTVASLAMFGAPFVPPS
ncbi:MAG TPA: hypothetical protein VMU55_02010, partial [Solirubrobacteraceae bacterium]|nr:hypothetical protein [Solirubrobacteraceae bacterium]